MMPDLLAVLILALSAFIHGALGFGMPLVATPLLVLFMDPRSAVLITLIPVIASNLGSILGESRWREALRRFWPIPVFTAAGSLSGTRVLLSVDPSPFRLLFALHTRMNPALMVATFNLSFITSKSGQLAGFTLGGGLDGEILLQSVLALPVVLASLWLGIRLRRRIDQNSYRRLLRYGLWAIAALLILDGLREMV